MFSVTPVIAAQAGIQHLCLGVTGSPLQGACGLASPNRFAGRLC